MKTTLAAIIAVFCSTGMTLQADPLLVPDASDTNLWAWYDAGESMSVNGSGVDIHGDAVTNWTDRTVAGLHSLTRTSGGDAIFSTNVINGLPAVRYPGNMDTWGDDSTAGQFLILSNSYTVVAVARLNNFASTGYVFDRITGRGGVGLRAVSGPTNRWEIHVGRSSGAPAIDMQLTSTNVTLGIFQTHVVVVDGTNLLHYVDGNLVAEGGFDDGGVLLDQRGLLLGADYTTGNDADCDITEVLAYSIPLTAGQVQSLSEHYTTKYDLASQEPPPPPPSYVDVFISGEGGYPSYRIPAFLTTINGTLLAFCEARTFAHDHAENDIVLRRSTDNGQTWLPMQLIFDNGDHSLNDPLVVQVREGPNQGRIYLFHMSFPKDCHVGCVQPGYGLDSSQNYMHISDDDGVTWSGPSNVSSIVRSPVSSAAGTPGRGIQMRHGPHAGRLVLTLRRWPGLEVYALYSDDGGDTWIRGAEVDESQISGSGDEVQVAELSDGTLMLNSRTVSGTKYRKIAHSYDGGATWTPFQESTLIEPNCDAGFIRYTDPLDAQSSRLLYAGPYSQTARVDGNVHISYDEGETWPVRKSVYVGGYAYSKLTRLPDNRIGVLFERDGYSYITFSALSLDWLTDGEDSISESGSPSVSSLTGASGIMPQAALLNGTLTSTGTAATAVSVFWGTSDGALDESSWGQSAAVATNSPVLPADYIHSARNLSANTPYFYRYRAGNIHGTNWSSITRFTTLADTDGDGISDDWEILHCGTSTGCVASAQTGDNDGFTYLEEYQLDLDPGISNAPFAITGVEVDPSVEISFGTTSTQRSYTAEFSTNLVHGAGWMVLQGGVPGAGTTTTVVDPAPDMQRYYRVTAP